MNKHLFELLRRIEDSARRLAATIMHNSDKRLRDIASVEVEIKEISDASRRHKNLILELTPTKISSRLFRRQRQRIHLRLRQQQAIKHGRKS